MTKPASELIALADNELLAYCRDDASRWASAFVAIKEAQGWGSNDIDNDLMLCWFANAIEGATAYRAAAPPPAQPAPAATHGGLTVEELARSLFWLRNRGSGDDHAYATLLAKQLLTAFTITRAPLAAADDKRWRHKKRGTIYTEIGRGKLQDADISGLSDNEPVIIYRSDADGTFWVRAIDEFEDGRFEALHSPKIAAAETGPALNEAEIRAGINILLETIAAKFEANDTLDIWRSDAASLVRSYKHAAIDRLDVKPEAKSQEPEAIGGHKRLHASGELRERVEQYWKDHGHKSKIDAVYLKGDGFVRVEWSDGKEFGPFHISLSALYLHPTTKPEAVAVKPKWEPLVKTVADLVNNLLTVDQTMEVHTAYFITYNDGRKEARTRSPSISRERVNNSRINAGDETIPYSLVIWTSQDERAQPATAIAALIAGER